MDDQVDLTGEFVDPSASQDEVDEANLQLLLKKRAQDTRRQVKDHWFEQFPWLQLDHERGLFFCRWCIAANKINTMTRGKSTQMPKKHYFQQHELHSEHQCAALQFWRSVATNSGKMGCSGGGQLPIGGEEHVTNYSSNSSLHLNLVLPDAPSNCSGSALGHPSSFVPSHGHMQSPQTINESYHITLSNQTATSSRTFPVDTPNVGVMTSPVANWNRGFDISASTPVSATDQSAIITSNVIAGLLDENLTPKGTRKIKLAWFTAFPWLVMDSVQQLFFCQYCCAANRHNIFTEGRTTANPKKDHFYKHVQTADHASAALWYQENHAQGTTANVSSEEGSTQHVDGHTEFVAGSHGNGGVSLVNVKEEVMSSEEIVAMTTEGVASQLPGRTDAAADCKMDSYAKEIGHITVGLPNPVNKLPINVAHPSSMNWHYDSSTIAQFLHEFAWLEYSVQGLLKCTACETTGKQNSFSYGQHPGSVTHKRLVMHERLPGHADAVYGLEHTLRKDTSAGDENTQEIVVKSEVPEEDVRIQPRVMSPSGGGDDVTMATASGSEVTMSCDNKSGDNVFSNYASADRIAGTPEKHLRKDWAKIIHTDKHRRGQISRLTNRDILDIVSTFLGEGEPYRAALDFITELWPENISEIQVTSFIQSVKALNNKKKGICKIKRHQHQLRSFLNELYKYPKRRMNGAPNELSTREDVNTNLGLNWRYISDKATSSKCEQDHLSNVNAVSNTAKSTVSVETQTELTSRDIDQLKSMVSSSNEETINLVVDSDESVSFFGDDNSRDLLNDGTTACESLLAIGGPLSSVCLEDRETHSKSDGHRKLESPAHEVVRLPCSSPMATPVVMERESLSYNVDEPCIETTESTWMTHFWQLTNQLRHLNVLCDVTLTVAPHGDKCKQHEFRAHRLMLVCASDLFKATLSSGKDRFHFDDVSSTGMKAVLDFIYGQPVHGTRSEYVDYYNAATALSVLPARTAFSKVIRDMGNNTGAAVAKGGNLNPRSYAKPVKMDAKRGTASQVIERVNRKQSVVVTIDQSESLLPSSGQTPIRKLDVRKISPSSILSKTNPTCKHPGRVLLVGGRSRKLGKLRVASMQSSSGATRCCRCAIPKCRRKFARQADLARHLAYAHTIQKRHHCNWCNKEFVWRTSLLVHEASHVTNVVSMVT